MSMPTMKKTLFEIALVLLCFQVALVESVKPKRLLRGQDSRILQTKQRAKQRQQARRAAASDTNTRIIGGQNADAGKYPYVAEFTLGCGGSLIAPDVLLTVAHCYEVIRTSEYAYVGSHLLREGRRRRISRLVKHPKYNADTSQYDFMLVQLDRPLNNVPFVQLNDRFETPGMLTVSKVNGNGGGGDRDDGVGELMTVIGFGVTEEGDSHMADVLQEAEVPYIPQETCQEWYHDELVDEQTMFCAGYKNGGIDSCQGDSGSPILNEDGIQVGVVSWGQGCARKKSPGVYGRVSAAYSWIKENVCEFASVKPAYCFAAPPETEPQTEPRPDTSNGSMNLVTPLEDGHVIELDIKYDGNPNQVAWILVRKDDDTIIDYIAYGDAVDNAFATVNLRYENLSSGNYTFLVTDSARDGICCASGRGTIQINEILPDGSSDLIWASTGRYGAGATKKFELTPHKEEDATSTAALPQTLTVARAKYDGA